MNEKRAHHLIRKYKQNSIGERLYEVSISLSVKDVSYTEKEKKNLDGRRTCWLRRMISMHGNSYACSIDRYPAGENLAVLRVSELDVDGGHYVVVHTLSRRLDIGTPVLSPDMNIYMSRCLCLLLSLRLRLLFCVCSIFSPVSCLSCFH